MRRHGKYEIRLGTALTAVVLFAVPCVLANPVWPPPPDQARVEYVTEIRCGDLDQESGLLGKIGRFLGGDDPDDRLGLPFDVLPVGEILYLTCQDLPALVRVDPVKESYRLYRCDDRPLDTPVALAAGGEAVFVTDSGNGTVYRLDEDDLEPWVSEGLARPTGLAVSADGETVFVVDTGDHKIKVFDLDGHLQGEIGGRGDTDVDLNYPTFATGAGNGFLVNDTLNYRMKKFAGTGDLLEAFGEEGNGPGTFSRPKGVAEDDAGHIWVVDALFDNIQIFDATGRLLLIVGGSGQAPGEFWSPAGIGMKDGLVYVADTFNNRIQVLKNLGGGS
ncbi:MAG: SMP-30/gluconolactonase/LRE family protein [Candidatus Krumholzibacteriota bacterium]